MFDNVGWPELLVLALVGLFVLGPERLPAAAAWVANTVRTIRDYATGARDQLRQELGPEFDELRKPLEDLRSVRDLNPRRAVRQHLFTEPPADGTWSGSPTPGTTASTSASTTASTTAGTTGSVPATPAPTVRRPEAARPLGPGEIAPVDPDAT
ncbi:Sec-independent protein translocase protein TatB [Actinomycetospora straminea]|uniref:Sec-independent protein translocase protein TatB n=1 Tax=Actinomycetospora straminea TaxID=663607 RepID=A0ABP9E4R2_9PSEU|nr:Sec-independent protein translocase protein TatB [Actinomycetospora straminea]MDD7930828.1 Sec-independent protein translocase protein TatB [Actinomycetospora straminea]